MALPKLPFADLSRVIISDYAEGLDELHKVLTKEPASRSQ